MLRCRPAPIWAFCRLFTLLANSQETHLGRCDKIRHEFFFLSFTEYILHKMCKLSPNMKDLYLQLQLASSKPETVTLKRRIYRLIHLRVGSLRKERGDSFMCKVSLRQRKGRWGGAERGRFHSSWRFITQLFHRRSSTPTEHHLLISAWFLNAELLSGA